MFTSYVGRRRQHAERKRRVASIKFWTLRKRYLFSLVVKVKNLECDFEVAFNTKTLLIQVLYYLEFNCKIFSQNKHKRNKKRDTDTSQRVSHIPLFLAHLVMHFRKYNANLDKKGRYFRGYAGYLEHCGPQYC